MSYEDKIKYTSIIAQPMASKKLAKKVYKVTYDRVIELKITEFNNAVYVGGYNLLRRVPNYMDISGYQERNEAQNLHPEWLKGKKHLNYNNWSVDVGGGGVVLCVHTYI